MNPIYEPNEHWLRVAVSLLVALVVYFALGLVTGVYGLLTVGPSFLVFAALWAMLDAETVRRQHDDDCGCGS